MRQMETPTQFVQWLRSVAPYIHAFGGKTFVVQTQDPRWANARYDLIVAPAQVFWNVEKK